MKLPEILKYRQNKYVLVVALFLGIVATLFPPFEWNHKEEGIERNYRSGMRYGGGDADYTYYIKHSSPIKTYEFLFGNNQKKFMSNVTEYEEIFNRSIILQELLVEYILIAIVTALFHIIFFTSYKKKLGAPISNIVEIPKNGIKANQDIPINEVRPLNVKKTEGKTPAVDKTQSEMYKEYRKWRSSKDE